MTSKGMSFVAERLCLISAGGGATPDDTRVVNRARFKSGIIHEPPLISMTTADGHIESVDTALVAAALRGR